MLKILTERVLQTEILGSKPGGSQDNKVLYGETSPLFLSFAQP